MHRPARVLVLIGVAVTTLLVAAAPAGAHALPQSSDPAAGATLERAPVAVTIVFGEAPDPGLSVLRVLDSGGHDHVTGRAQVVAGDPRRLRAPLGKLVDGVYTVSWRTVSKVDGHLAAGTFSFGVGVAATGGVTGGFSSKAPSPTPLSVVARWLLYVGLMGLVGAAFVAVACHRSVPRRVLAIAGVATGVGGAGALAITMDNRARAHLSWGDLPGSSLGTALAWRAIPIGAAAVVVLAATRVHRDRPRRWLVGVAGGCGLIAMWGDVEASHASAASTWRLLRMGDQWAHFGAAGIWAGGLVALVATIGAIPAGDRVRAAKRFSIAAIVCVVVIAATGVQRGYDETGTLHHLVHAAFGRYVLVKVALLLVLVALGAVNRFRSVPALDGSTRSLRRVGGAELVVLAGVLAVTAILQGVAPPTGAAASSVHPFTVSGHDFGTTVKVTLVVSPDQAGFNEFTLQAVDYDTGAPVDGSASLRFTLPARRDLGSSTLDLRRTGAGAFAARGANLSLDGAWNVAVELQRAAGGVEIPLTVKLRSTPQQVVVAPQGDGLPTLYTVELSRSRSVQTYLDPDRVGFNEVHVTFLGADGNEQATSAVAVRATPPGGAPATLVVRPLDSIGHFVADLSAGRKGRYRFEITATTTSGEPIRVDVTIPVQ